MTEIKSEFLDTETMKFKLVGGENIEPAPELEDFLAQPITPVVPIPQYVPFVEGSDHYFLPLDPPNWPTQIPVDRCHQKLTLITEFEYYLEKLEYLRKLQSGTLRYLGCDRVGLKRRK